jgi:1-acyl-sn-glycerol-3-phosphate acyltransferase
VRNWKKLQFPKVTVQYGEPFRYEQVPSPSREQQQAAAEEIFAAIKELYAGLDELGRAGARAKARVAGTTPA